MACFRSFIYRIIFLNAAHFNENYSFKQPQTAKGDLIEGFDVYAELAGRLTCTACPFIYRAEVIALEKRVTGISLPLKTHFDVAGIISTVKLNI